MKRNDFIKSIKKTLAIPFRREDSLPLIRPERLDWDPSLAPKTIQIEGHTVFYIAKGEGEPLILIHGYGAGIWVWERQIDVLSQGRRVYALDLLGHGFSDRPRIAYTPEAYIRFLKGFMDAVGVEQGDLIGNSMGGGLAWAAAAHFPERVKRLVLIDCIPPDVLDQVRNESFRRLAAFKRLPFLAIFIFYTRNKDSIRSVLKECVSDTKRITPEVVDRQYRLSMVRGSTWSLYSTFRYASRAIGLRDSLSRIRHPTLLIWGAEDRIFPPSVGEHLQRSIAGARLHVIEKSGHVPMWETPEKVNPLILAFLNERGKTYLP